MRSVCCVLGRWPWLRIALGSRSGVVLNALLSGALVVGSGAGCSTHQPTERTAATQATETRLSAPAETRQATLTAAVATLRDAGYAVDRADYRLGVVTSRPQPVTTIFEPWHDADQSKPNPWAGTLSQLRRIARITLQDDQLQIAVQLERLEAPTQRVINASAGQVFSALDDVPTEWADQTRGLTATYWRPAGHDPAEQARLAERIEQARTAQ